MVNLDVLFSSSSSFSGPASSTHLCTHILCLLADPRGSQDPHLDIPDATRTRCWLDIIAARALFLQCVCPTSSPLTPSRPLRLAYPTHSFCGLHCYMDSPAGSHPPVVLDSPSWATPGLLSQSLLSCCVVHRCAACQVLWTWPVMTRSLFLVSMLLPPNLLLMLWPPRLQTVMTKFPFPRDSWFRVIVMMRLLFRTLCFLVFPPFPVVWSGPALQACDCVHSPLSMVDINVPLHHY
jgi:hypothetical protein